MLDPENLFHLKMLAKADTITEKLRHTLESNISVENIVPRSPASVIQSFVSNLEDVPEYVKESVKLIGSSEAESENLNVANLMDILCLKKLVMYLSESNKSILSQRVVASVSEIDMLGTDVEMKDLTFKDLLYKLLGMILNTESLILNNIDTVIRFSDGRESELYNTSFVIEYQIFDNLINTIKKYKDDEVENQEVTLCPFQIAYYFLIKELNFHLMSQTDSHALNGDVLITSIVNNHHIQKTIMGNTGTTVFLKDAMLNINLYYELLIKFLHIENEAKSFTPTTTNSKQIRNQILAFKIQVQNKWVEGLDANRDVAKVRYLEYISSQRVNTQNYDKVLDYFLSNFEDLDLESSISENLQTTTHLNQSLKYSNSLEQYQELCSLLNIPFGNRIEPKVIELVAQHLNQFANVQTENNQQNEDNQTEGQFQLDLTNLPEYIKLSQDSIEDVNKHEFFQDNHRLYISKLLSILIETKVNGLDDPLYKFLYLKKCVYNPNENDLPPKKVKILNNAKNVLGRGNIPSMHFRIRVNKRGRMIVGLDQEQNKIIVHITDDHDLLK